VAKGVFDAFFRDHSNRVHPGQGDHACWQYTARDTFAAVACQCPRTITRLARMLMLRNVAAISAPAA
jgi:hypothetical protein